VVPLSCAARHAQLVAAARGRKFPSSLHSMNNESNKPHWLQRVLDNTWLLLVLGVVIPLLSYTVWGWIEILNVKPAMLP
jgi:hypothetical protein